MMKRPRIDEAMAEWSDSDLLAHSILTLVEERLIEPAQAGRLSYGASITLEDIDPLTGVSWKENAVLCDTPPDILHWLESSERGKLFHQRLQTILEQAVFFRRKDKS
jgi:hypothetical protein